MREHEFESKTNYHVHRRCVRCDAKQYRLTNGEWATRWKYYDEDGEWVTIDDDCDAAIKEIETYKKTDWLIK
jgi:hypothetical protein